MDNTREMIDVHSELMGLLQRTPYIRCEDVHRQYAVNWLMNNGVTLDNQVSSSKWIPVTQRLPEKMCQCVCRYVFGENEEYPFYQVLWYFVHDENPHFQNEGSMGLRVTHWMPLPEPPKGD